MTTIADIYKGAERLINQVLRNEMQAQGHRLTGGMEESLQSETSKKGKAELMEGFAAHYTRFVNDGVPAESVSFKQAPFLIRYFQQRGLPEKEATAAAFATIKVWMKEGMSTQASKRFSSTGSRQNMIENAMTGADADIDEYMNNSFDFLVDELYHKEKSEKI